MATFGLVHGAWHGAWCWERTIPELERLGHDAIAVDLPCDDPDATFSTYAEVIVDDLRGRPDLIVVAHSLGGLSAPLAVERLGARAMVYLCALIPSPGRSLIDQVTDGDDMLIPGYQAGLAPDDQGRTRWVDEDAAVRTFFHDCDDDAAAAAVARLRPQSSAPHEEPCPLESLPDVRTAYVVAAGDRIVAPSWSRAAARRRLGIEPTELPGGHSPFLSRPAELAAVLHRLA